jgi:hypothetical protein
MSAEQPRLWALDLDQTMLDTDMFFDQTAVVCKREDITGGQDLHAVRAEIEASGGSFDTFGYLAGQGASDEELDGLATILGDNQEGREYLFADTPDFLNILNEHGDPSLVVTYGSMRTQLPKLRATGLDSMPYLITPIKKKGDLIQTWVDDGYKVTSDNGHKLEGGLVLLVDDKPGSFAGLPEDSTGYLVQRKPPKPSQMGTVPDRITKVQDLATITRIVTTKAL